MPIRNPFARRPGGILGHDENSRPGTAAGEPVGDAAHIGFERVDTVGSKSSSALSVRSRKSQDTGEYKMSVVNDSGIYLPPSPVEKEATWPRRYLVRQPSDTKSSSGEIEHFSISRESFDSYRRSFDISAKSPIAVPDPAPRQSLDSARFPRLPRTALGERRFPQAPPTPEESFEEVGLNDETKQQQQQQQQQLQPSQQQPPKKRSFFAKFGSDTAEAPVTTAAIGNTQSMSRFLPGRKRGQSGQGAELGAMTSPAVERPDAPAPLKEQEVQS